MQHECGCVVSPLMGPARAPHHLRGPPRPALAGADLHVADELDPEQGVCRPSGNSRAGAHHDSSGFRIPCSFLATASLRIPTQLQPLESRSIVRIPILWNGHLPERPNCSCRGDGAPKPVLVSVSPGIWILYFSKCTELTRQSDVQGYA